MKAIANTTISLGLINLPVGICKATGELEDVKFNLGDSQGRRLTQQYVDPDGKVVATEDQTKAIDGHVIDKDAIEAIAERTKLPNLTITKVEDRARFDAEAYRITGHYYLQSTKKTGNVNAYKLFVDALKAENKVAVTKFTFRTRQQLMVIWPTDDGLLAASTLAFESDVREPDENVRGHLAGTYTEGELSMARQLLSALSDGAVDPLAGDTDEAVTLRHELVEQAKQGEDIAVPAEVAQPVKNAALADALAASLAAIKSQQKVAA